MARLRRSPPHSTKIGACNRRGKGVGFPRTSEPRGAPNGTTRIQPPPHHGGLRSPALLRLDGIRTVHTIAPSRGAVIRPTMLRVILTESDGAGQPIRTDFTLAEAREWLASEEAAR